MSSNYCDVFIIGTGELGKWIVEILSRLPGMCYKKIIVGSFHEENAKKIAFSSWAGTSMIKMSPEIEYVKINLLNIDETGMLLGKIRPKVIVNSTSLQSYLVKNETSRELWNNFKVETGIGPWLPIYLTLVYYLMRAVQKYKIKSYVINASYPDLVNPVLSKVNLAPACGIGDGYLMVPGIKKYVAKELNVSPNNITVYLIAHHSHVKQFMIFNKPGTPYYLKIMVENRNVTNQFNPDNLILFGLKKLYPNSILPLAASSASSNTWHFLFGSGEIISCVSGPNGEIGGYPSIISSKGVKISLPIEISMEEARSINEEAQKKDGVEKIEKDGSVIFTDKAYQSMKRLINYDCKKLKIIENKERLNELVIKYNEHIQKYS